MYQKAVLMHSERGNFGLRKWAARTERKIAERERAKGDALQINHAAANGEKHFTHLMLFALRDGELTYGDGISLVAAQAFSFVFGNIG